MIKFDSTHKAFNTSIKKELGKKMKNIIISGLVISSVFSLTGCSKTNNCDIQETHVHKFVDIDERFIVYASDRTNGSSYFQHDILFEQTDEYILVTNEEKDLYEYAAYQGLIKIDDNEEAISDCFLSFDLKPFYEYEYCDTQSTMIGTLPSTTTVYSWTRDSEHSNLTGKIRIAYPVYYGYNIVKNEDNEYELIKSNPYISYDELISDGYEYIKSSIQDFIRFDVINELDKNIESESRVIK